MLFLILANILLPLITQTDGSYVRVPHSSPEAIALGDHPKAVKSLKTWLLKRRLALVDETKVNQIATEMGSHHAFSNADVLKSAKIAGAKQVIFVDSDVSKSLSYGIFGQPRYKDVDSGEIDGMGKHGRYKRSNLTEGVDQLTCQALATAWAYDSRGMTSICLPGENSVAIPCRCSRSCSRAVADRDKGYQQLIVQALTDLLDLKFKSMAK